MKNTRKHWYIVSNRIGARVFEQVGIKPELKLVHNFDNLKGYLRDSELVSDRQGRTDSDSGPAHSSVGRNGATREHVIETFVHEISAFLEKEAQRNAFDSLVLVAEPHLLGDLNKVIGHATQHKLRPSVIKDLVHIANNDIAEHLKGSLCVREEIEAAS